MKTNLFLLLLVTGSCLTACKTKMEGATAIETPFSGNRYESNNRWFRAVASGESINMETSRDKAMLAAKQRLASAIQTQIRHVSEDYKGERQVGDQMGDFNERFQQLTREVMNQVLVEIQTIDQKLFRNDKNQHYIAWVAIEARKRTVYKKLKEVAIQNRSLSEADKKYISDMLDSAIKELGEED